MDQTHEEADRSPLYRGGAPNIEVLEGGAREAALGPVARLQPNGVIPEGADVPPGLAKHFERFTVPLECWPIDDCEVESRGRTDRPFAGRYVWLLPYGNTALVEGGARLFGGGGGVGRQQQKRDARASADGTELVRQGVAGVVAGHNLRDFEGEFLPQVYGDPDAVQLWPVELVFYVWMVATTGESPFGRKSAAP